jgi:hypothetical protein
VRSEVEVERSGVVSPSPIKDPPPRIVIFRGDKDVMWRVNLKDKTYAENSLSAMEAAAREEARVKIANIELEPTGDTKEIAGYKCKGVEGALTFEVDTGDEILIQPFDVLLWLADESKDLGELHTFWEYSVKLAQGMDQDVPLTEAFDKLWEEIEKFKGVPLGMELTMEAMLDEEEKAQMKQAVEEMLESKGTGEGGDATGNEVKFTRMFVSISDEKLDDSLFEVPEGFKKASRVRVW